ncbi:nucleic acid-binding protein [Wolfiporia cocos MD-104 SS10]|uniref:Nucleic acid-binding protein n=1 Tax=Wolfiporia cocos (strain MD-104) TaxID=742152 RepID=A0A2H3JMV7_WOLCO|nr:nucleic acid-binding protein [Wolfiporia cocos MD-104 SS10]
MSASNASQHIPPIEALRPVTVKQMLSAERPHATANFELDNIELQHITSVVHVLEVIVSENRVAYKFDDGTGQINGTQWLRSGEESHLEEEETSIYVRVQGTLSRFGNSNTFTVSQIHKVEDMHEVYFHYMEACYGTLYIQFGSPNVQRPAAPTVEDVPAPQRSLTPPPVVVDTSVARAETLESRATTERDFAPDTTQYRPATSTTDRQFAPGRPPSDSDERRKAISRTVSPPVRDPLSHLGNLERGIILAILDASDKPGPEDGVPIGAIFLSVKNLTSNIEEIEEALDNLYDQHYITPSDDLAHYKVTNKVRDTKGIYDLSISPV